MKSSVATASKNLLRIKARYLNYQGYNALTRVLPWSEERQRAADLVLYPAFDSSAELGDVLNRLGWYFPEGSTDGMTITVGVEEGADASLTSAPDAQARFDTDHLPVETVDPATLRRRGGAADRLLVWDARTRLSNPGLRNSKNVGVVDPAFFSYVELVTWGQVAKDARTGVADRSSEVFERLESLATDREDAYLFATGPSLDRAFDHEFPADALSVICNSIVRNEALLEHLDPDVLTFADPVFHFGPSRYAARFREDAVRAIREYDLVAVVPKRYRGLLVGHHPDLVDHVVGIRSVYDDRFRFPTADRLEVMGTDNIMTKFMLPVASALADRVRIVGADGRKQDESYFWEHSDVGQYDDDLMNTAFETHPAFFRDRVYEDYYEEHVETLTEMIEYGERRGTAYESVTPSYVPCLDERTVVEAF